MGCGPTHVFRTSCGVSACPYGTRSRLEKGKTEDAGLQEWIEIERKHESSAPMVFPRGTACLLCRSAARPALAALDPTSKKNFRLRDSIEKTSSNRLSRRVHRDRLTSGN